MKPKKPHLQNIAFHPTLNRYFVLITHEKKYHVVEVEDNKPLHSISVPSGMWLMSTFLGPGQELLIALSSRQGKTHIVSPGQKGKSISIDTAGTGPAPHRGYVGDLVTVGTTPILVGDKGQFYQWDHGQWNDVRSAFLSVLNRTDESVFDDANSCDIASADGEPAVILESGKETGVYLRKEGQWKRITLLDGRAYALAYRPGDQTLFAAGRKNIWTIPLSKQATKLPAPADIWAAAVFRDVLYLGDLSRIYRFDGTGCTEVFSTSELPNYNHCLRSHRDKLWFITDDKLAIYDGKQWSELPSETFLG